MNSWIDFWNNGHSIYVNKVHKFAHAKKILNDISSWIPNEDCSILDFGCGEALYAEDLDKKCGQLVLVDSSENIRKLLISRTLKVRSISIKDVSDCAKFEDEKFDLIIVNSVFQYLNTLETKNLLALFHRILKKNGKLVIADIIPPNLSMISDVVSLLKFGLINGFLFSSLVGLLKIYLSDYTNLRKQVGLSVYSIQEFTKFLHDNGFVAQLASKNFGHNQGRHCFSAVKYQPRQIGSEYPAK